MQIRTDKYKTSVHVFGMIVALFLRVLSADALPENSAPSGAGGCDIDSGPPVIQVTAPEHGIFTTNPAITVRGQVTGVSLSDAVVTVNGEQITLSPNCTFSERIDLDSDLILNPVLVKLSAPDGEHVVDIRERIVMITGDAIADGERSPQSLAIRLNESGLDQLESFITSGIDLDLERLLPPGQIVFDSPFVDVTTVSDPPPSVESFNIRFDAQPNQIGASFTLNNLSVTVQESFGIVSRPNLLS